MPTNAGKDPWAWRNAPPLPQVNRKLTPVQSGTKDISARFRLSIPFVDIHARLVLRARTYADVHARFNLTVRDTGSVQARFRLTPGAQWPPIG